MRNLIRPGNFARWAPVPLWAPISLWALVSLWALLFLGLAGCSPDSPQERTQNAESQTSRPAETERLNTWLDEQFAEYLEFSPLAKTRLGDKSDYGQLDDVSMEAMDRRLAWRTASVAEMKQTFNRDSLDTEGKLSFDLWAFLLARAEAAEPYKWHDYLFGRRGPHTGLPNSLINYHKVESKADMQAYVSRLGQAGRYIRQYLDRAKISASKGIRAPYFDYEIALTQTRRVVDGEPFIDGEPTAIWADVTAKIEALQEAGEITGDEAAGLTRQAREALIAEMLPAYHELIAWLEADRAKVTDEAQGAWALPDGEAYYLARLEAMTTLPLTAQPVHETGIEEVARLQGEMEQVKQKVGFDGTLQEFFVFMRESDQFYFPNTDEGREGYLQLAREYLAGMEQRLPKYFGILPKSRLEVRRVEAFREQAGGAAHYSRGTPDGERPGVFYAHLADMRATSKYRLENLAYHEGLPGHHLQIAIQQELAGIPRFRTYHGYTAYSEGWGLYSEYLAKEMGGYQDPYNDFGRLTGEIWRAIRLVVDTGIHANQWTEEQAIAYALENSPRPLTAVRSEIRRYFNNPAQATAYKIGMLKIMELRQRARTTLGDAFDIRAFHDLVLGSGPLPLPLLEHKVIGWIESVSGGSAGSEGADQKPGS